MGQLLFKKCFFDAIRDGSKRTTIRRWPRPRLKRGQRAFAPGIGWLLIEHVETVELARLDDADARADGFATARDMRQALLQMYPQSRDDQDGRQWFRVHFRRNDDVKEQSAQRRRLAEALCAALNIKVSPPTKPPPTATTERAPRRSPRCRHA
jgi:hypothetical protein